MFGDVKLSDAAAIVSLVAGLMTILGIGGLLSWSVFGKARGAGTLAGNTISVFAFSMKTGFCLVLLWPLDTVFLRLHFVVVSSLGPAYLTPDNVFWHSDYPFAYLASYLIAVLLFLPLYLLACACVYVWSLDPFRSFIRAVRRQ